MHSFTSMDLLLLLFLFIRIPLSSLNTVQNGISGQPLVECGNEFIRFTVKTVKPFRGKVFVKGQYGNSDCGRNYSETHSIPTFHSGETATSSTQKRDKSPEEINKIPLSESIQKTNSITDAARISMERDPETVTIDSTVHDHRSTVVTTKPHSSKEFNFNAKNEYGSSIASTMPHCPPCPVCQDELKINSQQEVIESTADLLIKLGTCNIKYEQQIDPRAMIVSLTVVVSFHQNLLTKLDRAFRIQCAYMEGNKAIDADLNVSMPPSIKVESEINSPHCIYTVKSPTGKVITNARVGELVEHQWICQSPFKGVYAMLVKNCYAESNDNFRVPVIDENGCTLDPYILPNLQYASDLLSVKIRASVFKFPDRSEIGFRCDVLVCLRSQHDCELITPPKCTNGKRKRRDLFNISRESLILRTPRINIIDLDDVAQGLDSEQFILNPALSSKPLRYCLTVTRFACIIASTTFLITTTATLVGASIISSNSQHIDL